MPRTLSSARQARLAELLVSYREAAGMTQVDVARALGRHQPFISNIEAGQRRVDIIELLDLAAAIGFEPRELIDELAKMERE